MCATSYLRLFIKHKVAYINLICDRTHTHTCGWISYSTAPSSSALSPHGTIKASAARIYLLLYKTQGRAARWSNPNGMQIRHRIVCGACVSGEMHALLIVLLDWSKVSQGHLFLWLLNTSLEDSPRSSFQSHFLTAPHNEQKLRVYSRGKNLFAVRTRICIENTRNLHRGGWEQAWLLAKMTGSRQKWEKN